MRTADVVFNGQVLNRLEKQRDAVDLAELWLEAANHAGSADFALGERF